MMKPGEIDWDAITETVAGELEECGAASLRVGDGHAFFFTAEKLDELRAQAFASEEGVVMIIVKRHPEA